MPIFPSFSKLFGTPPAAADAAAQQDEPAAAAEPKTAKGNPAAASAASTRAPHQRLQDRTLSHVFTQLPKNLPNRADIHVDVLEWLMHVALLQTDPVKLHHHILDIEQAITNVDAKIGYGRLHSRMHLTAFYADVCDKTTEMKMGPGLPTTSTCPTFELAQWKRCHDDFNQLRRKLLRKDANVVVPVQVMARRSSLGSQQKGDVDEGQHDGDQGEPHIPPPPEDATIDAEVEQHPMMQADYEEVLQLFAIQDTLADLQIALQKIQKDRPRNVAALVKGALQSYNEALKKIFHGPPAAQLTFTSSLGGQKQSVLVAKLSQAIQDVCLNDDNLYSYAQLQQKTRTLLIKWSESILEIPTLFALGYGGVMAPVVEQQDGDDDVSSFGQEEEDGRLETQAPDPLPYRRSKYAQSPPKEPGFGSSPDEQIVLEQLSRGSSPPRELEALVAQDAELQQQQYHSHAEDSDDFPVNRDDDEDMGMEAHEPQPQATRRTNTSSPSKASRDKASGQNGTCSGDEEIASGGQRMSSKKKKQSAGKRKERDEPELNSDDDSLFNSKPDEKSRRTRVLWTSDETETVIEGVTKFGPGQWTRLKQWAGARLENRDPVAIKDKWRNIDRASIDASLLQSTG